ncbi:MAG: tetratricopeptide repeat protein, partial [Flavobacteriales bacterium]|nr:tetratricopeptide repeat protein [Flavobacteriales bacterium]
YKLKDYEGAVADCDKAISLDKNYAAAYLNRGIAYEMLRKEDKACEDWNKAAELGLKNGKAFSQQICN